MTENIATATHLIRAEHDRVLGAVDGAAWDRAAARLRSAPRVFTLGGGRSGLALQMAAMRFMHLGLTVHVVGETTTPAITEGDVLLAASGSGTTGRVVAAAETARKQGARVIAVTTAAESPLTRLADEVLIVPAADKQDFDGTASQQYAGSLFEQSVLLLCDGLFHLMWTADGTSAEDLWRNHANLD